MLSVSVHGVLLLSLLTVLVEADLARADPAATHAEIGRAHV